MIDVIAHEMDLFEIPQEILSNILSLLSYHDLISVGLTCRQARSFITHKNQLLWRSAFLHMFDDPNDAWDLLPFSTRPDDTARRDWYDELRRRITTINEIKSKRHESPLSREIMDECHVLTLIDIIETTKCGLTPSEISRGIKPQIDDRTGKNLKVLESLYHQHGNGVEYLIHNCRRPLHPKTGNLDPNFNTPARPITRSIAAHIEQQARPESASRLHTLFGLTIRERSSRQTRGMARRLVYDWSLATEKNEYGPFKLGTGTVNWVHLEAICSVMGRLFELCADGHLAMPQGFCYSIPYRTLIDPTVPEDWARVTGSWLGTYAFVDYAHLFAFNTWHYPRPTLDDEPEACGDLMRLDLKIDHSPHLQKDRHLQTSLPMCRDLPMLYFSGRSRGHNDQLVAVEVRGFAHLVPGGREVRWRFIISYGGADQWQLEGVQPGGIRSGGVYGLWSQSDHEENGPVGPFCYFPMELCKPTSLVRTTSTDGAPE